MMSRASPCTADQARRTRPVALPAVSRSAWSQTYPSQPVRIIVGFAAGGPNDILARLIGQWLSERLRQPFVIENRPGAATNVGTEAVVNAAPDGYTVLMASSPHAINATLYEKLHFNFIRDIAPVAGIMRAPNVMVVAQTFPVKSVLEFIRYAKANPGRLNFASSGIGASNHMSGELFKMVTGGDPIFAERKHGQPFSFVSNATPFFSANEPPLSSDQTQAYFDRWVIVPMDRRIPDEKVDPHLLLRIGSEPELQGLLVRAVDGLRRALARGRLDLPPSVRAAASSLRTESSW